MLEKVDLHKPSVKGEYKQRIKELKTELGSLQQLIKSKKLPVIVLFEGWGASGKGSMIREMISAMDPRSFKVYSTSQLDISELRRPFLWKYWRDIPEYGRIHILDRSWYQEISVRALEMDVSEKTVESRIESINTFERQLIDDGYLIIKFFMHISKKQQGKRFKKLSSEKSTSWRVKSVDLRRNEQYERYYQAFDRMCSSTDATYAPWNIVGGHDKEEAVFHVLSVFVESVKKALSGSPELSTSDQSYTAPQFPMINMKPLSEADLSKNIAVERYREELKKEKEKLFRIQNKLYRQKTPVVLVFEGWDAAGKGGAIKRVASALDPRGYEAIPVAAPSTVEINHQYLWRFWNSIPKTGHLAIFDRSWYGRVMVERVEGFTDEQRWSQAFREINEFEYELTKSGIIVSKFWLQIDKEEQLKRFTERQNAPEKRWKITPEDWRNREKWDLYEAAVDEMLQKTSTTFATWHVVEANDKLFARLKVIKTINQVLEAGIQ